MFGEKKRMCGIVAVLAQRPAAPIILSALKRLEYRGYDSSGIATLDQSKITRLRASGKLNNLEEKLSQNPLSSFIGIGHTRWATHGKPSEVNAHPHATQEVALVHNGIIENYATLKQDLISQGIDFESDTDTEVVVQLVTRFIKQGKQPEDAVRETLPLLKGTFALVFLFQGQKNLLIAARYGAPLALGIGENEVFIGSDALALAPLTSKISYLEDGDWVVATRENITIRNSLDEIVERHAQEVSQNAFTAEKGDFPHFMLKEIFEQPEVISRTLSQYIDFSEEKISFPENFSFSFKTINRLTITACGTAYYAGMVARYWFEKLAKLNIYIDVASELRYREPPVSKQEAALVISQSGETADSLASLRYFKDNNIPTLSVVNVATSTIARESDCYVLTLAGPEIGVASTKAFTCQLTLLFCLVLHAAKERGELSREKEVELIQQLHHLPTLISDILKQETNIITCAQTLSETRDVLYLGRGLSYPIALEGALKLKEISYIHAEGYAAGELKHGPIALIEENVPVVVIAPDDYLFEKTFSNMQEVAARGGSLVILTSEKGAAKMTFQNSLNIILPPCPDLLSPLLYTIPVQLLAYHVSVFLGKDIDQPRNLAKSVTVE